MKKIGETVTIDPGLRSSIELLYGPRPAEPDEVRGQTVRGKARHSPQAALEAAIDDILPRLGPELRVLARRRLGCQFAHGPTSGAPHCPDPVGLIGVGPLDVIIPNPACQAWIDEIAAWHRARFGPRFSYVTYNAISWMSTGRAWASACTMSELATCWTRPRSPSTSLSDMIG